MIRFMCSFDTTPEEVRRFLEVVDSALVSSGN
jgi:threonine aldolase